MYFISFFYRRYEQYARTAQANKIELCEKEIKQLKRALEKSDVYVEELENKIEAYKAKYGDIEVESTGSYASAAPSEVSNEELSRSYFELLADSNQETSLVTALSTSVKSEPGSSGMTRQRRASFGEAVRVKREVESSDEEDGDGERGESSTFQLDQPSPITPASSLRRLTLESTTKTTSVANSSSSSASTASAASESNSLRSCTRQLDFNNAIQKNQSESPLLAAALSRQQPDPLDKLFSPLFDHENALTTPSTSRGDNTLEMLDYSITPELEDCTRLLTAAEERVHQRRQNSLDSNSSHEILLNPSTAILDFQLGTSTQEQQCSVNNIDYLTFPSVPKSEPSFQFNPVFVPQTTMSDTKEFLFDPTIHKRPPSAPVASSNPSDYVQLLPHSLSTVPSHTYMSSVQRPNSAPLAGVLSTQPHSTLIVTSSNPCLPVLNAQQSAVYTTALRSTRQSSLPASSQYTGMATSTTLPQSNQDISSNNSRRSSSSTAQQKTVYVLSGSRIAPLGERRKRNSSSERRERSSSRNLASPAKSQKF